MIKVNLLPAQRQRNHSFCQRWAFQRQIGLAVGILLLTFIGCWLAGQSLNQRHHRLLNDQQEKVQTLARLKSETKEIERLEQIRAILLADDLLLRIPDKQKMLPIIMLDVVSESLDPLNLWINTLSMSEFDLAIEGGALGDQEVSRFIENLEQSMVLGKLTSIETQIEQIENMPVHHFNLSFRIKA